MEETATHSTADSNWRRFGLLDGMIVVAATALGFSIIRPRWDLRYFSQEMLGTWQTYFSCATDLWFCWSVAVVMMFCVRPRPPLQLLIRQPGLQACFAVLIASGFRTFFCFSQGWTQLNRYFYHAGVDQAAGAVAIAWASIVASGGWLPVANWQDRLGRFLGWGWMVLYVVSAFIPLIRMSLGMKP